MNDRTWPLASESVQLGPKRWNYTVLLVALLIGIYVQLEVIGPQCRCWRGVWTTDIIKAAGIFNLIFLGRIAASIVVRERNRKWIAWAILVLFSGVWIVGVFELVFLCLGPAAGVNEHPFEHTHTYF